MTRIPCRPKKTISIMECHKGFEPCSCIWDHTRDHEWVAIFFPTRCEVWYWMVQSTAFQDRNPNNSKNETTSFYRQQFQLLISLVSLVSSVTGNSYKRFCSSVSTPNPPLITFLGSQQPSVVFDHTKKRLQKQLIFLRQKKTTFRPKV